ncbi:pentapeptide repeat-containing protein [Sphaerospermopsis reniformis]|uniref:Pentapeptide repeat-containing protein n=1 Tax=Sphaerospermopsis reniformis TaxID=531300 RepID=A0A480A221_9CYAN|nr:pentapeptide repeat-containing protein [Sphaerospermopsis reniformis]GCL39090.1 pentapeptide repeat-containing protein [Sphaerospermopsis reniformis]
MNNRPGIVLKKPVGLGKKEVSVKWRDASLVTAKVVVKALSGKFDEIPENIIDIVAAFGLAQEPGEIAYVLISSALTQTVIKLLKDNKDLLEDASQNIEDKKFKAIIEGILNQCLGTVETEEITIYQDFFKSPQNFTIVQEFKTPFSQWLQEKFNLDPIDAEIISNRLPIEFLYSLYSESDKHSDKYAKLKIAFSDNAFSEAVEKQIKQETSWRRYSAWLQKQVEERMFLEAFGLKQVYVPLRAYYEQEIESDHDIDTHNRRYQSTDNKIKRYVVNLQDELQSWLNQANKDDAIRVISGGPGSGKSSFTKMWAAKLAEIENIRVLFIPLHLFNPQDDLVDAIGKFIESMRDIPLPANPLKLENSVERLLIIFDGLDELAMQGKMAEEVAHRFISEVRIQVNKFNYSENRLMVLISGREIVVQKNQSEFLQQKQIFHILSYFINKREIKHRQFIDDNKLLEEDQRHIWWKSYGDAKNSGYSKLPDGLDRGILREITAQPLLNYLVALSYDRDAVKFTENSNLNEIYADLITKVYQRVWANNQNPQIHGVKEQDFVRILESIAIAAWHGGDIRVTTLSEIEKYCDHEIIDRILNIFNQDKRASFTRLLTAFYFRQHGVKNREETFEFTHKSFGEYLAAKGIVRQLKLTQEQLQRNQEDSDVGWDKKQALEKWAEICGLTAMDEYIFDFLVNEILLQQNKNNADVGAWQQMMCNLISYMLKYGMPMEKLSISTFQEANRQARNAEEALLAVLNACARVTQKLSQIKWPSLDSKGENIQENKHPDFGNWISRLRGQRVNYDDVFCLNCLSFLDLQNTILTFQDFSLANLQETNLQEVNIRETNLTGAKLQGAKLQGAKLQGANLQGANLQLAYLREANLQGANLQDTKLQRANLQVTNLQGANLQNADIQGAKLQGTNLQGANLQRASLQSMNFKSINLQGTNLQETNLQGANLQAVNLPGSNLQGANLQGANLQGANLQGVNLQGANLQGTNFQDANLQGTNFQDANLQGANLEGTNFQDANLQRTNLQRANLRRTNLQRANLQRANLQDTKLQRAYLQGANLQGADVTGTIFEGKDLTALT